MTDKKKRTDSNMTDQELVEAHASLKREKHPPTEGFLHAPLIFVFVFGCLIFVCSIQLAHTTNNFQLHPPKEAVDPLTPEEKEALRIERKVESGKKIFAARCASCHQDKGQGIPGQFPPLDGSKWVTSDPGLISKIIIMGLKGEIEVKGVTYGSNPAQNMVAVPINDREIANVVTYVRQAWSNEATEVTEEEVSTFRAESSEQSDQWTGEQLLEMYPSAFSTE